jgi:hypothetical protein
MLTPCLKRDLGVFVFRICHTSLKKTEHVDPLFLPSRIQDQRFAEHIDPLILPSRIQDQRFAEHIDPLIPPGCIQDQRFAEHVDPLILPGRIQDQRFAEHVDPCNERFCFTAFKSKKRNRWPEKQNP